VQEKKVLAEEEKKHTRYYGMEEVPFEHHQAILLGKHEPTSL
jgi:hypothetical protein